MPYVIKHSRIGQYVAGPARLSKDEAQATRYPTVADAVAARTDICGTFEPTYQIVEVAE